MYNRFLSGGHGAYSPEEATDPPASEAEGETKAETAGGGSHPEGPERAEAVRSEAGSNGPEHSPPSHSPPESASGILRRLLDSLHISDLETGDLLLLCLLFLLFQEGADDETLAALGLLLIL